MPLIRVIPKIKTEKAEVYKLEGRYFAIIRTDPDINMQDLEHAQQTIHDFLGLDVLVVNFECDIELVEAPPPTWHERVKAE